MNKSCHSRIRYNMLYLFEHVGSSEQELSDLTCPNYSVHFYHSVENCFTLFTICPQSIESMAETIILRWGILSGTMEGALSS